MITFTWSVAAAAADTSSVATSEIGAEALRDWSLDAVNGDLELDATGDAKFLSGAEAIASDLESRLKTSLGEWFLDTSIGFPWFQDVLGQKFDEGKVRRDLESEAAGTPGVTGITSFSMSMSGRTLSVAFLAAIDTGLVISVALEAGGT